jgi:Asp-tRNA(Asn)/Glu-tRNA(Gln) amidotransferase A subunit family amidase
MPRNSDGDVRVAPAGPKASKGDELAWTPGWRLLELMASKKLSPVEYARSLLDRIERYGTELGAFITVFPDYLLASAREAEAEIMRGERRGRLHGLPISVKDTVWTKGLRTTLGSLLFADFTPERDAISIERMRDEGGIVFAKANTPEFAMNRRTVNLVAREALNPWDRRRTSGGSSGGSAVAVAAGLGPMSVGTDGGGSIRIPSSFNGVFGLYPSRGLTPNGARVFDNPNSGMGPITRDVRDAALLLQVMAGPDDRDLLSKDLATPPDYLAELEKGVGDLRVAWSSDFGRVEPERPKVLGVCHALAQVFEDLGAAYDEPSLKLQDPMDALDRDPEFSMQMLAAEVLREKGDYKDLWQWLAELPRDKYQQVSIYVRDRTDRPTMLEYTMSIRPEVRNRRADRLAEVFNRYDLLLSPVIDRPAFLAGDQGMTPFQYTAYTFLTNVAGYCAASVPAGFVDGMPVGLQIMGRPGDEALLLRAARALEQARPWAHRRPPL